MKSNTAVRHKRNKHGRTGVPKRMRNAPLADQQKVEIREKAFADGVRLGRHRALLDACILVDASKTIRAARKGLREMAG